VNGDYHLYQLIQDYWLPPADMIVRKKVVRLWNRYMVDRYYSASNIPWCNRQALLLAEADSDPDLRKCDMKDIDPLQRGYAIESAYHWREYVEKRRAEHPVLKQILAREDSRRHADELKRQKWADEQRQTEPEKRKSIETSLLSGSACYERCASFLLAEKFGYPKNRPPPKLDPDNPESVFQKPRRLAEIHKVLQEFGRGLSLVHFAIVLVQYECPQPFLAPRVEFIKSMDPLLQETEVFVPGKRLYPIPIDQHAGLYCLIQDYTFSKVELEIRAETIRLWKKHALDTRDVGWLLALMKTTMDAPCKNYGIIGSAFEIPWCERRQILIAAAFKGSIRQDEVADILDCKEAPIEHAYNWYKDALRRRAQNPSLKSILDEEREVKRAAEAQAKNDELVEMQRLRILQLQRDHEAEARKREEKERKFQLEFEKQVEETIRISIEDSKKKAESLPSSSDNNNNNNKASRPIPTEVECPVCMEVKPFRVLNPCGHTCCAECYQALLAKNCPTCRSAIASLISLYLP
jgi:hypothetical protein